MTIAAIVCDFSDGRTWFVSTEVALSGVRCIGTDTEFAGCRWVAVTVLCD